MLQHLINSKQFFLLFTYIQVSWIRKRDSHILSVDRTMFIADERFQAIFVETQDTWTLQVKYVQARDEGDYECQISTEPKLSHIVKLNVVGEFFFFFLLIIIIQTTVYNNSQTKQVFLTREMEF